MPQRFYVTQQAGGGDRHVYATLTRFLPPAVERHFEQVGPLAAEPASPSVLPGLGSRPPRHRRALARRLDLKRFRAQSASIFDALTTCAQRASSALL